jgi:phosphoribosylformylglycinamidine cyclo-ligase
VPELGRTLGEEMLAPHRCYARPCCRSSTSGGTRIHALAHITGGGFYDNIPRACPPTARP